MVVDVGGDASGGRGQRSAGRRRAPGSRSPTVEVRAVKDVDPVGEARQVGREPVRGRRHVAGSRRDGDTGEARGAGPARARSAGRRTTRPRGSASARSGGRRPRPGRGAPPACRPCTTAPAIELDPADRRTRVRRQSPARPWRGDRSAGLIGWPCLCGGRPAGTKTTRSRPSARAPSWATARCAMWIGSNVPPNTPSEPPRSRRSRQRVLPGLRLPFELGRPDPDQVARRDPGAPQLAVDAEPRELALEPFRGFLDVEVGLRRDPFDPPAADADTPSPSRSMLNPSVIASIRWTTTPAGSGGSASSAASGSIVGEASAQRSEALAVLRRDRRRVDCSLAARALRRRATRRAAAGRSILLKATSIGLASSAGSCARSSSRITS